MSDAQEWTVIEWDQIDGGKLGAVIVCAYCEFEDEVCKPGHGCDGTERLFQEYHFPNGCPIDLHRDAEIYIEIECPPIEPEAKQQ